MAGLTPLRDLAALGDNLTLVLIVIVVVFRASLDLPGWGIPPDYFGKDARAGSGQPMVDGDLGKPRRSTRSIGPWAGGPETATCLSGGCLVVEAALVPILMMICDGFLLAWVLTELRNAGLTLSGEDRLDIRQAIALMPASALACVLALPSRYVATFVFLTSAYFPTWLHATSLGRYVRWQLGWGLTDLQAAGLAMVGLAGAVAWSRGTIRGSLAGYRRLLAAHGGHLVVVLAMAVRGRRRAGRVRVRHPPALAFAKLGPGGRRRLLPLCHAARRPLDTRGRHHPCRAIATVRLRSPIVADGSQRGTIGSRARRP